MVPVVSRFSERSCNICLAIDPESAELELRVLCSLLTSSSSASSSLQRSLFIGFLTSLASSIPRILLVQFPQVWMSSKTCVLLHLPTASQGSNAALRLRRKIARMVELDRIPCRTRKSEQHRKHNARIT